MYLISLLLFISISDFQAEGSLKVKDVMYKKVYYNLTEARSLFDDYMDHFNKKYDDEEYEERLDIFKKRLELINHHNTLSDAIFGLSEYTDLKDHEMRLARCVPPRDFPTENSTNIDFGPIKNVPAQFNWQDQNAVTRAKNQNPCGSCWAFSAVGAIEGLYARKTGRLVPFSEQEVLDCSRGGSCDGGWPHDAMTGIAQIGMVPETSYPYVGQQKACAVDQSQVIFKFRGGERYTVSEEQMKQLVYNRGPISALVYAGTPMWSAYQGGLATAASLGCPPNAAPDHAILIVGYGELNGIPYWIIKNSWGGGWGSQGFIHLARNQNACSISGYVAVPVP